MAKVNPHCPVNQCRTKKPHTDDPLVSLMMVFSDSPQVYLHWVKKALLELRDSMVDDYNGGRQLSWMSRIRLVEELYYRSLYLLFFASAEEVPHLFSGQQPNSFSHIYDRVNEGLRLGQGALRTTPDAMEWINIGAHVSFPLLVLNSRVEEKENIYDYLEKFLDVYVDRINIMGKLFVDGEDTETVKKSIIRLHQPSRSHTKKTRKKK